MLIQLIEDLHGDGPAKANQLIQASENVWIAGPIVEVYPFRLEGEKLLARTICFADRFLDILVVTGFHCLPVTSEDPADSKTPAWEEAMSYGFRK